MKYICKQCNKDFKTKSRGARVIKYCSKFCYGKSILGKPSWNKGIKLSKEHITNLSNSHKGKKTWNTGKIGVQKGRSGELCIWWKGGITKTNYPERVAIINTIQYKKWRKDVFERDDYTCRVCQIRGGKLEADHIKKFSLYPELRFELSNGRTLCRECHLKTPTYGNRNADTEWSVLSSIGNITIV